MTTPPPGTNGLPDFRTILAELGEDHVLTVTLNRPERLNAFNQQTLDDFSALWRYAAEEDAVHVVVLQAEGERAFCTGVDVVEGIDRHGNPFSDLDPGTSLSPKLNRCWKPLVCAVHGMVAGGALYWLNEADIIIADEDATFFDPHTTYGMVAALEPIGLARRIPIGEVLRMVLLGNDERMSARRACEIGFVSEVVERTRLRQRAHELAALIAAKPPVAVQGSVKAIWESLDTGRSQALATGLAYTQIGNPIGKAQTDREAAKSRKYEVR
ncbi:enoyl-CoA hydratase/isomerase family protein [Streptomyces iranensis]|uniref:Enoyl-CoA hydratase/carnithine racemase n=1 Tax=Streptomyces iranensis TaxID=576784 RepID=A0A061ADJ7_9ACTN|nr:enoyl-CoA hydratase/isomerase family protein [Streptomyces iranensis]MBP2067721.1 enoyl-CoA hydratase/carnithine racemase [Streptomyces iranensis]CDR17967.1 Enoyl-CoA hydratase/isomerase [Streptomyces iranensis]